MDGSTTPMVTAPTDPEAEPVETRLGPVAISREGPENAPAILCIHGLPGSTRDFRHLAPRLAAGLHVVRIDMPGFGRSPAGRARTQRGWSHIPAAVADALALDRYLLTAHSFGGGAAILAASRDRDRVAGLVLIASVGASRHRAYAWPPILVRALLAGTWIPGLRTRLHRGALEAYRRIGLPLPADMGDLRRDVRLMASLDFPGIGKAAGRLNCPTLVAYALDDPVVEPAIGRDLVRRIPDAEALEFPEGGHHLQKTRAPEISAAALERFA